MDDDARARMAHISHVRRSLAKLRQRWEAHTPAAPMCLAEELDDGVTVADFCVRFLLAQRTRRSAGAGPPSAGL